MKKLLDEVLKHSPRAGRAEGQMKEKIPEREWNPWWVEVQGYVARYTLPSKGVNCPCFSILPLIAVSLH